MDKTKYAYEENYFKTYFPKELKKFTSKDVKKNKNWFWGWFRYLNKFTDLKNGKERKVLEIGCAVGSFSSILKDYNFDIYASDISKYVIKFAKKFYPEIKFYNFDVQKEIPINEQFDLVFSFEVLEHLENPQKALENIYKKLSPNGILICSTPPPYMRFINMKDHINVKSAEQWHEIFEEIGFKKNQINIEQVAFIPFLYRYSKYLSLAIPLKINFPYINSTYFLIAMKL